MCKIIKPMTDFGLCKNRYFDYGYVCKQCRREHARRNSTIIYGITMNDYNDILLKQGGGCAICGKMEQIVLKENGKSTRLSIDHNHSTGKVRGILCRKCNMGIGQFNEDVILLTKAVEYLKQ